MFSKLSYSAQTRVRTRYHTGLNRFQLSFQPLSTCPFHANIDVSTEPPLVHVPSLPFVGSALTWYSNTPERKKGDNFNYWLELRKRFGGFYAIGKQ